MMAAASARATTPANTQRQDATSTSQPPNSGPTAVEAADQADHWPIASPRSSPSNADSSIARLFGTTSAPAAPCTSRSTTRLTMPGAIAHPADVTANAKHPAANTVGRWNRSPSAPPSSIRAVKVSRYPLSTHCNPSTPRPKSRAIAGRATLTVVPSRKTAPEATIDATRIHLPWAECSPPGCPAAWRFTRYPWAPIHETYPAPASAHRRQSGAGPSRLAGATGGAGAGDHCPYYNVDVFVVTSLDRRFM